MTVLWTTIIATECQEAGINLIDLEVENYLEAETGMTIDEIVLVALKGGTTAVMITVEVAEVGMITDQAVDATIDVMTIGE